MVPTHGPGGRIEVATAAGMQALGRRMAGLLHAGDLVVLSGPLGAGKTTLVQGIGQGLGVRGPVTSPTFVIARVHPALRGGPGPGRPRPWMAPVGSSRATRCWP